MLKAYDEITGKEIKKGDTIINFRGDKSTFIMPTRERTEYRSGKVVTTDGEYYDGVFNIIVKEVLSES